LTRNVLAGGSGTRDCSRVRWLCNDAASACSGNAWTPGQDARIAAHLRSSCVSPFYYKRHGTLVLALVCVGERDADIWSRRSRAVARIDTDHRSVAFAYLKYFPALFFIVSERQRNSQGQIGCASIHAHGASSVFHAVKLDLADLIECSLLVLCDLGLRPCLYLLQATALIRSLALLLVSRPSPALSNC